MDISLINTLDCLKPCKRLNYLQLNNYKNPTQIMSDYIQHTKQKNRDNYNNAVATKANKLLDKSQPFQSVNFDTTNEPLGLPDLRGFKYTSEWVDKFNIIAPITEPINSNYIFDICEGVYRIIIKENITIELDMNRKTFKITDDKATIDNTILNIRI
jgi:hypothetical protein